MRRSIFLTMAEEARQDASVNRNGIICHELAAKTPNDSINEKKVAESCPYKIASMSTNSAAGITTVRLNGEENS